MDIIGNFIIGTAIGIMLFSIKSIWRSNKEIKRYSLIGKDMPKYRWLMQMGMQEQAKHFNAFGLRSKKYKPSMWY